MTRRQVLRCLAGAGWGALALPWAPLAHAAPAPEKNRLGLAVADRSGLACLPLAVAERLGYFRAEGLQVEVREVPDTLAAAWDGGADVYMGPFDQVLWLHARGKPHQSLVLQGRTPQVVLGVSHRRLSRVQGLADLAGRSVGVPALSTPAHWVAQTALAKAGVKPPDVRFVEVGDRSGALDAYRSGRVDALSHDDPLVSALEQSGDLKVLADTRRLGVTTALFGGAMPGHCLYGSADFARQNPATCLALNLALVHALKWLQTAGPSDIVKVVPEPWLGDRAVYLSAFTKLRESYSPDGLMPEGGPGLTLAALRSVYPGLQPARVELSKTYTNTYARQAKLKFKA